MRKPILIFTFLLIVSPLWPNSIKFIAMDKYYDKSVPIDSILVYNMKTGEEKIYLTDSIFFETLTAVEGITKANNLQLYPNPVGDILNINLGENKNSDLIISDINGRVQYRTAKLNTGQILLNVAGLPQGVYAIRSGNQSQTFIKNTSSNGQEICLLTTSYMPNSLVKEAEVQSQFDYRFTIYSKGFKPYIYNNMALTKDTVVKLDMASLPSTLDGKHIRVELFLSKLEITKHGQHHNNEDTYYTTNNDFSYSYTDTVFVRDSLCNVHRKTIPKNSYFTDTDYDIQGLSFIFDKDSLIKEFHFTSNFKCSYRYDYSMEYEENSVGIKLNINLDFKKSNTFLISDFKDVEISLGSRNSTSQNNGGSSYYTDIYGSYTPSKSYIKIEFID